jgi:purine nucleoside phosphorylase
VPAGRPPLPLVAADAPPLSWAGGEQSERTDQAARRRSTRADAREPVARGGRAPGAAGAARGPAAVSRVTGAGRVDPAVAYEGPRARAATLGGSPTWGLGDRFDALAATLGHARLGVFRPRTPYGLGPQVEHYRTPSGREFLRIPTYGQVVDEDPLLHASEWKTFWICWQAGVEVLLVGGTSGSCDWRRGPADEAAVRPGDFVLPKSYLTRHPMPTGLPGTELEFCLPRQVAIMDDPFCPPLAAAIRDAAGRPPGGRFRRIHGPEAGVVLHRWLTGNGFESLAMCRELEALGRLTGMPIITGDCVSPVLARVCQMHLAYYHVVANWGTGLEPEDPTLTLDHLYTETLPGVAASLELEVLDRLEAPAGCRCRALLRPRPAAYAQALSPPAPP